MAKIPPLKRLSVEDFPDQNNWIARLLQPINDFFSAIASALNKNISWADNIQGEMKSIDITINGSGDYPIYFKSLYSNVKALWIGNCYEVASSPSVITSAVYISWENTGNGQVKINNITGLATGKKYRLVIVTLAG